MLGDHGAGAYDGVFADSHAAQDRDATADAGSALNQRLPDLPVSFCLQRSLRSGGTGILIVNKDNAVADEDLIFNGHAFADKAVTRDFAVAADGHAFLDFDERADFGSVTDLATVKIYEVVDGYVLAKFDVGRDYAELSGHEI